jgi:hypothetical protein
VHTGQNPPITLARKLCSGVSVIHAAILGKHNQTKLSALFISSQFEMKVLKGSNTVEDAWWNPALVLAAILPFGNLERRARRRTAFAN